ncbi:hypothetical protein AB6F62_13250 [Providencia huaxiensis]|uniref:hypothetical protein n=1 Tax=Providencia huaxiensis TaxID=2027290 RepID=UPI0034DD6929
MPLGPNAAMAPFSVPAEGYGQFMADVFDEWIHQGDIGKIYIRLFDSFHLDGLSGINRVQSKTFGQRRLLNLMGMSTP